jgi:sn-glycerol 3-phosphate transport system substrate-binding protein
MAKKLTVKDASGKVTQWGIQMPSSGFPYWLFQGLAHAERRDPGQRLRQRGQVRRPQGGGAAPTGSTCRASTACTRRASSEWGTTPKDFFEKKVAMMWTTTGNLTNMRTNAKFDFGVAMLPAGKRRGSPTGGGNFYIFKKATPAQQEAAFKFAAG